MSSKRLIATATIAATVCIPLSGCFVIGGGTTNRNVRNTVGQELLDLKAARDKGAIDDEEYDLAKRRILGQGTAKATRAVQ